ncbi:MAG: radical SAM family heme chaperone HemW [Proteobacteria bacterium]|nr:radical SAM family heme chaperone HemW [Pseudomonadota bacterium]
MGAKDDPGFGVYVHWPFCASKCPYCDFNSHVRHVAPDQQRFVAAFARELGVNARRTPGRTVSSIFLGGGTPSLMEPATVGAVLDEIARLWPVSADCEVTLEANPTSVEAERFKGFRAAGVNRVSLGVQALDDKDLKSLGRMHSVDEALRAVDVARRHFDRYSFDLIYARPGQTAQAWEAELRRAISEAAEHLSLYQLTIEAGTVFEALHKAGKLAMPDPETGRVLYDLTQDICAAEGLPAYEISNHARPGAECRHNLIYWRSGDFVGAGPGAHGRLTLGNGRVATSTERHPETWLDLVERQGSGVIAEEHLVQIENADEFLVMGLRLSEGIDLARYEALSGQPLDAERIDFLEGEGLVQRLPGERLKVTALGFPVLDAVVADLARLD